MSVLVTFIPWFLFWFIFGMHMPEPAAVAGFVSMLIICANNWRRGKSPKALEVGTLSFFLILVVLAAIFDLEDFRHWLPVSSNAFLFLIAFVSILIRKPFIMQYSRERVPRENWDSLQFIRVSFVISWFWCTAFLFNLLFSIARAFLPQIPRWLAAAFPIVMVFAALKLTELYAKRLKSSRAPDPI